MSLHIACPHCHNRIEIVDLNAAHEEVLCPSCGSSFHLDQGRSTGMLPESLRTIDRFQLVNPVGAGAFGTVYKARDPKLDRTVAVKVPRAGNLAGGDALERFLREARSVAQLRHPAIVSVFEVGQLDGQAYLVSEFVDGVTLADQLTAKRFSPRESAELIAAVADALHYAHTKGVVHRDVKPANIMLETGVRSQESGVRKGCSSAPLTPDSCLLTPDSCLLTPRLMDFGMAKRDAGEITMTHDGQVLGTPAYMSPEQARGEAHKVDGRSDVYSLGVILYELLTGELPFRGNVRMLLHQVLHDEPRAPRRLNDNIARDLETICLKAMAKEPGKRYGDARGLADDLRRYLQGEPIRARPSSLLERTWRWCRRNPAAAAFSATLALGAGLAFALALWALSEKQRADGNAENEKQARAVAHFKAGEATEALLKLGRESKAKDAALQRALLESGTAFYCRQIGLAEQRWRKMNIRAAELTLSGCEPDLRGWEWDHLQHCCARTAITLKGHAESVAAVAFSPDGQRIVSASADKTLKLWSAKTGQVLLTLKGHTHAVTSVAFSPDGRQIVSGSVDRSVRVWSAATGREVLNVEGGHADAVLAVAFSPDGRQVASGSADNTVKVWSVATGQEIRTLTGHTKSVTSVAFSGDGQHIASGSRDETVKIWSAATGRESRSLEGHFLGVTSVTFHPDGQRIASGSEDQIVRMWSLETGKETLNLRGHSARVLGVAFSADGKRIVTASADQTVKVWLLATAQEVLTITGHAGAVHSVAFSPDGERIASGGDDHAVRVSSATTAQESVTLKGHSAGITSVAFHADGRRIVSGSWDQSVKVWSATTGDESFTFKEHRGAVYSVAFSPDGRRIACGGEDQSVMVWSMATVQPILTFKEHAAGIVVAAVIQARLRHEILAIRGQAGLVWSVAFSHDGQRIVSGSGDFGKPGAVRVWSAVTGQESVRLGGGHADRVTSVAFSPDGRRIASGSWDATVKVWSATTGEEIFTLKGHAGAVTSVAFSPDGQRLASASEDRSVKVWSTATGQEVLTLKGHSEGVTSVGFSADGQRIVTGSWDRSARVWSAATGQETLTLTGHSEGVTSVGFSADGHHVIGGSSDATVKVWSSATAKPDPGALFLTTHRLEAESWAKQQHAAGAICHYAHGSWEWLVVSGRPWVR